MQLVSLTDSYILENLGIQKFIAGYYCSSEDEQLAGEIALRN